MAKIEFDHYFEVPIEEFIRILFFPTEDEINDLTDLPNVKEREEIERYEDEKIIRTKVRYFAMGFIPPQVRRHLKPHMLSWIEHSAWHKQERYWEWRIEPHFFKELINCTGKMSLLPAGERTRRSTRGVLRIKIPLFGELIEKIILEHLRKNFDAEVKMFHDTLKRNRERREKEAGGRS